MKSKTIAGIVAILTILIGSMLIVFGGRQRGWFSTPTFTPTRTPTPTLPLTITPTGLVGDLGWGSIGGKVVDLATGKPVAGVTVTCQQYSYTSSTTCNGKTITASDGSFLFQTIFFHDTDRITLKFEAPGYVTQTIVTNFFISPGLTVNLNLEPLPGTPTATPTLTATRNPVCTPPPCAIGTSESYTCTSGNCPGGCGTTCATYTPTP
jgi:hypothetical protein